MVLPDSNRVPRVPLYLGTYSPLFTISLTGLSPSLVRLSSRVQLSIEVGFIARPATPTDPKIDWFGLFPLRSPLLGESLLISLPEGTEMFHFPSYASLGFPRDTRLSAWWVSPFRNCRVEACLTALRHLSQSCHVFHRL